MPDGYNILEFAIKKEMLNIAICDCVKKDREQIAEFCRYYLEDKLIKYEIKEYASGESFLVEDFPDVLFLNTKIKSIDGILIKEVLHKMHANTKIAFVSKERNRVLDAFGKNVYGFIEKPILYKSFAEKMEVVLHDVMEEKNSIFCKRDKKIEKIFLREIVCVKAYGRYTKIYLYSDHGYLISDKCFGDWYLEMENSEFLCSHRSYLVNACYIKRVEGDIELENGMKIPLSSERRREFFESYKAYIRSNGNGFNRR